MKARATQTVP